MRVRNREVVTDEAGVTLVELLVAIIVASLVIGVISATLVMGTRLGPDVQERSSFAADASFLVDTISNDVANATSATSNAIAPSGHLNTSTCVVGNFLGSQAGYRGLYRFQSVEQPVYHLVITEPPSAVPDSLYVQVQRKVGSDPFVTLLDGYCNRGEPVVDVTYDRDAGLYTLSLSLRVREGGDLRPVTVSASHRRAPAPNFTLTGTMRDAATAAPLAGRRVTVWNLAQTNPSVATLDSVADGTFSTSLAPGTYLVCQTLLSGWTESVPTGPGTSSCNNGTTGRIVSNAHRAADFASTNAATPTWCSHFNAQEELLQFPGNRGPDTVVNATTPGASIQNAIDTTKTDTNGDGYIIVGVVHTASGGGRIDGTVVINEPNYPRPFALIGCNIQLRNTTTNPTPATATIHITAAANAPAHTVNSYATRIFVHGFDVRGRTSGAATTLPAVLVEGNERQLDSVRPERGGIGVRVVGHDNTLRNVRARTLLNHGISVDGRGNHLEDVDAEDNDGDGFNIRGGTASAPNRMEHIEAWDNTGAEFRVLGYFRNVEPRNKANDWDVPEQRCSSFPANGATVNFTTEGVCDP